MAHNHNPLIIGFLLSSTMFGIGVSMGYLSLNGADWQSRVVIQVFGGLLIVAGIYMLRNTFKARDECPICKDKFHYGRKKNEKK